MRAIGIVLSFCCLAWASASAAELTDTEKRWLEAGMPVLEYAQTQGLPIDVVVQPQPTPGQAPLALGLSEGRCKLVLSMRGNPMTRAAFGAAPEELQAVLVEAMTAHELAHCWRHVQGAWYGLPPGLAEAELGDEIDKEAARRWRDMRATRREEGFADLVGLAWTHQHHPSRYAEVYTWLRAVRNHQPVPGSFHDTRAWLRLAADPTVFDGPGTPFERVQSLWTKGLLADD